MYEKKHMTNAMKIEFFRKFVVVAIFGIKIVFVSKFHGPRC